MHKGLILGLGAIAILVGGFFWLNSYIYNEKQGMETTDYKDAEYMIGGARVKLQDGVRETEAAPGSASKVVIRYFGNDLVTDLNDDGREDVVFLLSQETGGSGTFYYVVAALNTDRGYVGSEAFFLGDRIAPQNTGKGDGKIVIVNFADRVPGEPFSTPPSVGKSISILLDPTTMQFGEVEPGFTGEADPSRMSLGMKPWTWVSALYNNGQEIVPNEPGVFTLTFESNGRFAATTDCNSMGGSYAAGADGSIVFPQIMSTEMYCEGSQETEFASPVLNAQGYHFTDLGELILDLKFDSGSAVFR